MPFDHERGIFFFGYWQKSTVDGKARKRRKNPIKSIEKEEIEAKINRRWF